jgi:hypothetical protein
MPTQRDKVTKSNSILGLIAGVCEIVFGLVGMLSSFGITALRVGFCLATIVVGIASLVGCIYEMRGRRNPAPWADALGAFVGFSLIAVIVVGQLVFSVVLAEAIPASDEMAGILTFLLTWLITLSIAVVPAFMCFVHFRRMRN